MILVASQQGRLVQHRGSARGQLDANQEGTEVEHEGSSLPLLYAPSIWHSDILPV